jgi:site-specific recombinase XerD
MNIVHFGIDHLRVNFPDKSFPKYFKDYFEGLSANSNFKEVEWHGNFMQVVFISTKQKHILNFSHKEVPVLCLEKITDSGIGRTCAYVLKFHSSYFQYPELRNIFREFMFSKYADKLSITRLDICVDIDLSVDEFFKEGFETQFKVKETRKFGKKIQTQYFGTRNATNKKHFIRVYNKLLDTERKAKFGLYLDYFAYENVTRIEVQLNSQSCKEFGINQRQCLASYFNYCVKFGYLKHNPTDHIDKPKLPQQLPRSLTQEQAKIILSYTLDHNWCYALERSRNYAIVMTFLHTGLRLSELLNLQTEDVDLHQGLITVHAGKGQKDRLVPIDTQLKRTLMAYQDEKRTKLPPSRWMFSSVRSPAKLTPKNVQSICRKISLAANIKFTPHMLRHTFARTSVEHDMNLFKLMQIMGHTDLSTTQRYLVFTYHLRHSQEIL